MQKSGVETHFREQDTTEIDLPPHSKTSIKVADGGSGRKLITTKRGATSKDREGRYWKDKNTKKASGT